MVSFLLLRRKGKEGMGIVFFSFLCLASFLGSFNLDRENKGFFRSSQILAESNKINTNNLTENG